MAPNTYKREGIDENVKRVVEHYITYNIIIHLLNFKEKITLKSLFRWEHNLIFYNLRANILHV
jgi:hypothetical protein